MFRDVLPSQNKTYQSRLNLNRTVTREAISLLESYSHIYWLEAYVFTCPVFLYLIDVNECEVALSDDSLHPNNSCLHKCENFPGSFRCLCKDGYQLKGKQCEGMKCILISWGRPTFREVATWALAKRRLSNECRNSILMTWTKLEDKPWDCAWCTNFTTAWLTWVLNNSCVRKGDHQDM